jgi:hypothetical protein
MNRVADLGWHWLARSTGEGLPRKPCFPRSSAAELGSRHQMSGTVPASKRKFYYFSNKVLIDL